jgi:hypothetical protein
LQHVAAERRAIADLRRCGLETGIRERGRVRPHEIVLADGVERRERADDELVAVPLDPIEIRDPLDVDDALGLRDAEPHPVEELGAAGDQHRRRGLQRGDGLGRLARLSKREIAHDVSSVRFGAPRRARPR